jgi:hypothetical protein
MSAEDIAKEIESWKEDRRAAIKVPSREEKRKLNRALQYATNPLPYLDHLVFAYFLFDTLGESPVEVSELMCSLPEDVKNCSPARLEKFFKAFPHLLHFFKMGTSAMVQRADLNRPVLRDPLSLTPEEVILSIVSKINPQVSGDAEISFKRIMHLPHEVRQNIKARGQSTVFRQCPHLVEIVRVEQVPDHSVVFKLVGSVRDAQMQRHAAWAATPSGRATLHTRELKKKSGGHVEVKNERLSAPGPVADQ